ncbi:hypothetical protein GVAV_002651 [Gurleya vavrai]
MTKNRSTNPLKKSISNDKISKNFNLTLIKNLKKKEYCRLRSYYIETKIIFYKIKYKYFLLLEEKKNIKITGFFPCKKNQNIDITKYLEENYFDSKINDANGFYFFNYRSDPILVEKFNIVLFKLFNLRKLYLDLLNSTEKLQDNKSEKLAKDPISNSNLTENFCNLKYVQDYSSSGGDEDYRLESDSDESNNIKKSIPVEKQEKKRESNEYDEFINRSFYKRTSRKDKTSKNKLFCNDKFELTYIYLYQSMFQFKLNGKKEFDFLILYCKFIEDEKHDSNAIQSDFKISNKKENKDIIFEKSLNPFFLIKNTFLYTFSIFSNFANYIKSWIFASKLENEKLNEIYNTLKDSNLNIDYNIAYLELNIMNICFNKLQIDVCEDIMINSGCSKAYIDYILTQNKFKYRDGIPEFYIMKYL